MQSGLAAGRRPDGLRDTLQQRVPTAARPPLRISAIVAVGTLVVLAALVTGPVLPGVLWALMIGYWTSPLHVRLCRVLPHAAAAALMTVAWVVIAILPTLWLISTLQDAWIWLQQSLPGTLETALARLRALAPAIPFAGGRLLGILPESAREIDWVRIGAGSADAISRTLGNAVLSAGDWAFHAVIAVGTLFFVYLDGARWWKLVTDAAQDAFGERGLQAVALCQRTASAVTRGVILTAVVQGVLAGVGYWVAGAPQPLLLAVLTVPAAIVPLGAGLVWVSAAAWLALTGHIPAAAGLALWGALVVGTADNALRPLLMRDGTPLAFWPLTLAIIGGTLAFGVPGVYIGPITYALARMAFLQTGRDLPGPGARS